MKTLPFKKILILMISSFFSASSFANLILDNQTNEYLTLYFTSTGSCPGKNNLYALPNTHDFQFNQRQMLKYCKWHHPCYGYLYAAETLNYAKVCSGIFVGTFIYNLKKETIQTLFVLNSVYTVKGEGTDRIILTYT